MNLGARADGIAAADALGVRHWPYAEVHDPHNDKNKKDADNAQKTIPRSIATALALAVNERVARVALQALIPTSASAYFACVHMAGPANAKFLINDRILRFQSLALRCALDTLEIT
jgi:hypothetical protein